jgi:hypothetical protein
MSRELRLLNAVTQLLTSSFACIAFALLDASQSRPPPPSVARRQSAAFDVDDPSWRLTRANSRPFPGQSISIGSRVGAP